MTDKYTQGPWTLRKNSKGEECGAVIGADGMLVATTGYRASPLNDEDDANARLIAAAPELKKALQALYDAGLLADWNLPTATDRQRAAMLAAFRALATVTGR